MSALSYKQVIVLRKDLKLPAGKAAAQASHASVQATLKAGKIARSLWSAQGMMKIVVRVDSEKELIKLFQQAKNDGLPCSLITDAGKTVIAPGTKTAVAIGPATEDKVDELTQDLKLYWSFLMIVVTTQGK